MTRRYHRSRTKHLTLRSLSYTGKNLCKFIYNFLQQEPVETVQKQETVGLLRFCRCLHPYHVRKIWVFNVHMMDRCMLENRLEEGPYQPKKQSSWQGWTEGLLSLISVRSFLLAYNNKCLPVACHSFMLSSVDLIYCIIFPCPA